MKRLFLLLLAMSGAAAFAQPQPPGLQINCPPTLAQFICATSSSVAVKFAPPSASSPDCPDAPIVVCTPPSGSVFPLGSSTVMARVTNACDEIATCFFTVIVARDTTPPVLACTNLSVFTHNPSGRHVYFSPQAATTDATAMVACVPPSGSFFPVGATSVRGTARDACGNQSVCAFNITVTLLKLTNTLTMTGPVLAWPDGAALESAGEVVGPWLPLRGASSPFPVPLAGAKNFFRLTAPVGDADCGEVVWSPSVWNIDVPSVRIQGRFLLNGRPFPSSFLQGANFFLRRASTGDEVYLGLSNNETFDRRVVPGIYDVIYEHKIGDEVPLNTVAVVIAGLEISGDQTFDIDVPIVGVGGEFQFNGVQAPASALNFGRVQVRDRATGDLTFIGLTRDQTYAVRLIPRAYDLMYSSLSGSDVAPANPLTAFRRDVPIVVSGSLNMDVPTISVTGNFTLNGAPTSGSVNDSAWIYLLDPATGSKLLLGSTTEGHYQRVLIPGAYDVVYEQFSAISMPANLSARFLTGLQLVADGTNHINIPVVEFSGDFLVNGVPAPDNSLDFADIQLRQGEDIVYLGRTRYGHFSVRVIPGTYNVNFESLSSGSIMPANTNAVLGSVVIAGPTVFDINILAVNFAADVRFNGGNFPGPIAGESARLFLEDPLTGDLIPLAFDYPTSDHVARRVVRGTYRVRYEYESGTTLPRNTFATLGSSLVLAQDVQTVIDVRAVALSGDFRLNGGAFPGGQFAAVTARSLLPGDSLYLGGTQSGAYSTVIVPGRYSAFYNWAVGDLIPRNQNARLICPR